MFRKILLVYFLVTFFASVKAQTSGTIQVTVFDKNGSVPGVIITTGAAVHAVTDAGGNAELVLNEGNHLLMLKMPGYSEKTVAVNVPAGQRTKVAAELREDINPLEEVVVSTERYAQKLGEVTISTDIIKPALIENRNFTSLDQMMSQVPGVTMADGQASIRGGSGFTYGAGSRVLLLVDEMPLISADAGDIKWNFLPIENLEQVEIVKGAASVLYGSGALNGVVNMRTAFARDKPRTTFSIYRGQYDAPRNVVKWWSGPRSNQGINFSHARKLGNLDLVVGAHKFVDEGYRMLEEEDRTRGNLNLRYRFPEKGLSAGVNANLMNTMGGLFFLWQNYDSAYVPRGLNIQKYNNTRFNVDPWISYNTGTDTAGRTLSLRTRYFKTNNSNDKNQDSYAELYYTELQYRRWFRRINLSAGLVHMEQVVLGDSIYGMHRGRNLAGYFQFTRKFFNKLTLVAGVRGEYYRLDTAQSRAIVFGHSLAGFPVQPVFRVGANYQLAAYTYLRASAGQGYRFPSVAEKYVNTSVSALRILPNPGLQPERALSAEVSIKQGLRVKQWKGFADLSLFTMHYRDMIEFVFDIYHPTGKTGIWFNDAQYAGFKSQNIGGARISGAELGLSGSGNLGPVAVNLFAGYTYISPVFANFDPARDTLGLEGVKTLKYRSRHLLKADVQLEYKKFHLGYSVRFQSRIENIDRRFIMSLFEEYNNPPFLNFDATDQFDILPGLKENYGAFSKPVWIQDVRAGWQITRYLRLSVIVNNIFNVEYQNRPGDVRAPTSYVGQLLVKF